MAPLWDATPDCWTVVHRPADQERVGYLAPLLPAVANPDHDHNLDHDGTPDLV